MGRFILLLFLIVFAVPTNSYSQERRKILISNATLSYSALPLVAARQCLSQPPAIGMPVRLA